MSTEALQISLVQKIFSIRNKAVLKKISALINKEMGTVVYDGDGIPLTEEAYIRQIDEVVNEMESGADKGSTPSEVYKKISNAHNLE